MSRNDEQITIEAEFIRESTNSAFFNCEGDFQWFPKSQIQWDAGKKELTAPKWLLQKKFPNEKF